MICDQDCSTFEFYPNNNCHNIARSNKSITPWYCNCMRQIYTYLKFICHSLNSNSYSFMSVYIVNYKGESFMANKMPRIIVHCKWNFLSYCYNNYKYLVYWPYIIEAIMLILKLLGSASLLYYLLKKESYNT